MLVMSVGAFSRKIWEKFKGPWTDWPR